MKAAAPVGRLLVFAREPVAGKVKTRLIPMLGEQAATAVYRRMLEDTLVTATQAAGGACEIWADRPGPGLMDLAKQHRLAIRQQSGGDLGARMHHAITTSLRAGTPVVLIGSDCPGYSAAYLDAAFQALASHDAVLGPAGDGGYVLMGLRHATPGLFADMPWGSGRVMAETRRRLAGLHYRWHELPLLHDVDTPDDLGRYPGLAALAAASRT